MMNNNNPLLSTKPQDTELFGEFQNFTKSAPKESSDFLQLNSKIDDIMCQLGLLRNEIKELKQQLNISQSSSPSLHYPNQTPYHNSPTYPGQPMPPYPYQHQQQHQRYNSYLNSFQANS